MQARPRCARVSDPALPRCARVSDPALCYNTICRIAPPKGSAMTHIPGPIVRLVGSLCVRGTDWDMPEFGLLFERLGATVMHAGLTNRYVRYFGYRGERVEVRFFGLEVGHIEHIPRGMIALEIGEDSITVLGPGDAGPTVTWRGDLTWAWLDRSPAGAAGDFVACVPAEWTCVPDLPALDLIITANSYFERGADCDDDIRLVEYDQSWPAKYDEMAAWLSDTLDPDIALRIEHYGSTAIPGMPAKPVIDILLEVPSFAEARRSLIPVFNRPECEYWWYNDHMCLIIRKRLMGTRTHHIHAAPAGHRIWDGIEFRDYLRAHPDQAERYAALKRELAECHGTDREAYTNAKHDFVSEITARALRSAN